MCKYFVCVLPSDPHFLCCAQEPGPVSMETGSRRRDGHTSKMGKKACARLSESSESSDSFSQHLQSNRKAVARCSGKTQHLMMWMVSTAAYIPLLSIVCVICCHPGSSSDSDETLSDEDEKDSPDIPACTPLAAFLSFKQESEKRRASQVQLETTGKVIELCHHLDRAAHLMQDASKLEVPQIGAPLNCVCVCVFLCCPVVRVSPGGGDVPLADFSGAVLPLPAAAAAGRPVPGPAEEAPRPASPPDEGSAGLLPSASQGQEQHHQQPGGGDQPAADAQSTERG